MAGPARLLQISDPGELRREVLRIGGDPESAGLLAERSSRLVRLSGVPAGEARVVSKEIGLLSGKAVLACGAETGALPETDILLAGTSLQLRQLCRELAGRSPRLKVLAEAIAELLGDHPSAPGYLSGRTCRLKLDRPLVMGILNATPDSFSDGGRYDSLDAALRHGMRMAEEGADLIDVGGESTRPGAAPVSSRQEMDRIVPVIELLSRELPLPLSVDTSKADVAREAVLAGAEFVNDISGFGFDPEMASTVAATGAGAFLMHTRGRPGEMQKDTRYGDLMGEILAYLRNSLDVAEKAGIPPDRLAVDPGIGFGKSPEGNLEILRRLPEMGTLGRPVLLGTSRKGFIGRILDLPEPDRRLFGTLSTIALGVAGGAHVFRVHDVGPAREAALMAWAICRTGDDTF